MKVHHSFPKNQRYMKRYIGVQTDYDELSYWYDGNIKQWTLTPDWSKGDIGNTFGHCRSVKAFKRRLYEWSQYLPKGTKFILLGRYVGQQVNGKTF